jgi:chromosome segregation ATPase
MQIQNLKDEQTNLNDRLLILKDEENKYKVSVQRLSSEISQLESKKTLFETELNKMLGSSQNDLTQLGEKKQSLQKEINVGNIELSEINSKIESARSELRNLKEELKSVETHKEEYTSKISELIAMEKNLRFRISEMEKKIENNQTTNES